MRNARRAVAAMGVVVFVIASSPGVAHAANVGPDDKGWWSRAQAAPSPAPTVPVGTATGTDALVGNDPTGPNAIAAVRYTVPGTLDGEPIDASTASGTLTLKVAANGAVGTPVVVACPIISSWQSAAGGTWDTRPKYTCANKAAGTFNTETTAVTFALPPKLQARPGAFDLAIVPDPANQTPFSVEFEAPGADSLALRAAGAPSTATSTPGSASADAGSTSVGSSDSSTSPTFLPGGAVLPDGTTVPAESTTVPGGGATNNGTGSQVALSNPVGHTTKTRGQRIAALLLLVLLGVTFTWFGRGPTRRAKLSGSGGIGRFARPRTERPPRL